MKPLFLSSSLDLNNDCCLLPTGGEDEGEVRVMASFSCVCMDRNQLRRRGCKNGVKIETQNNQYICIKSIHI